jgi:hypothetical protein
MLQVFDSHHLHVALGPGPPRCAGPAAPRLLHCPPIAVAPLIMAVRQGASSAPRRGAASFTYALRPPSSPCRPRGPSGRVRHAAQGPLTPPPSPPCYRHRPANHGCSPRSIARTQEGCRCFQPCSSTVIISTSPSGRARRAARGPLTPRLLHRPPVAVVPLTTGVRRGASPAPRRGAASFKLCASTTIVSTSPSRPLWPGPPRCASPSPPRRLHRPAIAIAQLTTGVRQGASPAPGRGATFFHPCVSTTIVSTSPSGRVRRAPRVPLPLVAFTALLSPSHRPPRVFTKEYHHGCSPRSLHQPCPAPSTPGP